MIIATHGLAQPTTRIAGPALPLARTDPANIDLAVTEPIDISSMIQLLLDRH